MKPVIALVGRPNVGKSTLFNRLTKTRDAIVADFAGLTRDRHYGNGKQGKLEYIVIDTGGFEPTAETGIYKEMAKQTRQAVAEADVVIFMVDARDGVCAQDHDIAKYLRSGRLRQVLENWQTPPADIYAVYPQRHQTAARVRAFVDYVVEAFSIPTSST